MGEARITAHRIGRAYPRLQNKKKTPRYLDLRAVIASQYTRPGAKPTIRGIQTGHPSVTSDMLDVDEKSYLNPSLTDRAQSAFPILSPSARPSGPYRAARPGPGTIGSCSLTGSSAKTVGDGGFPSGCVVRTWIIKNDPPSPVPRRDPPACPARRPRTEVGSCIATNN